MGDLIGALILLATLGGVVWFILSREKPEVEPGQGNGGGVQQPPQDEITEANKEG